MSRPPPRVKGGVNLNIQISKVGNRFGTAPFPHPKNKISKYQKEKKRHSPHPWRPNLKISKFQARGQITEYQSFKISKYQGVGPTGRCKGHDVGSIAATGNSNGSIAYPARWEEVIAVGAITNSRVNREQES